MYRTLLVLLLVLALAACGGAANQAVEEGGEMTGEPARAAGDARASLPLYLDATLTDVHTEESFRIADLTAEGKYVLVEMMAVWCTNCLQQQEQIKAYEESEMAPGDIESVALDVDLNESPELLLAHTERHGFGWRYATTTPELVRAISDEWGQPYLNPPNVPMLLVRPDNSVVALPFGIKSSEELASLVEENRLPE